MKTKLLCLAFVLVTTLLKAQTCEGLPFSPPATPSSFDFNYKTVGAVTGWYDASDNLTTPPTSGNIYETVGVFTDLTYNFGSFKENSMLYVAPGVTFTGNANALNDNLIIRKCHIWISKSYYEWI